MLRGQRARSPVNPGWQLAYTLNDRFGSMADFRIAASRRTETQCLPTGCPAAGRSRPRSGAAA